MNDEVPEYAVHFRPPACVQLANAYQRVLAQTDLRTADRWYSALRFILAELSKSPWCYAPTRESWLFGTDVQAAHVQPDPHGPICRILFSVTEADDKPPFVTVLYVRDGVPEPPKRTEARKSEEDNA